MSDTSIMTISGKLFDFLSPDPEAICIEDIAHALSLENRYSGHTPFPYSVAQHSILMAAKAPADIKIHCLLHDAAEAYMGDVVFPQKHCTIIQDQRSVIKPTECSYTLHSFKEVEEYVLRTIYEALGVDWPGPDVWANIKVLDRQILAAEVRVFFEEEKWGDYDVYTKGLPPLNVYICERRWRDVKESFMNWWRSYRAR